MCSQGKAGQCPDQGLGHVHSSWGRGWGGAELRATWLGEPGKPYRKALMGVGMGRVEGGQYRGRGQARSEVRKMARNGRKWKGTAVLKAKPGEGREEA